MTLTRPVVQVIIEKPLAGDETPDRRSRTVTQDFTVADSRDFAMDVDLDMATGPDGTKVEVQIDIANLPRAFQEQLVGGNFVRLDGGYPDDKDAELGIRPLYFSTLQHAYRYKKGAEFRHHIATTSAPATFKTHIPFSIRSPRTIGDIMRAQGRKAGVTVNPSDTSLGRNPRVPIDAVTLENYTSKRSFEKELVRLMETLTEATKRKHQVIPSPEMPFVVDVIDIQERAEAIGVRALRIDIERDAVHHASPVILEGETDDAAVMDPISGLDQLTLENPEGDLAFVEYRIQMEFDPRAGFGNVVEVFENDDFVGRVLGINQLSQRMGNTALDKPRTWFSTIQGPFIPSAALDEGSVFP